jgi:hypothetical protein
LVTAPLRVLDALAILPVMNAWCAGQDSALLLVCLQMISCSLVR